MTAENIKLKVGSPKARGQGFTKPMTLDRVKKTIKSRNLPADVEYELVKMASNYPFNALTNFVENLDIHLSKVRRDLLV